ncbi:tRNA(Ile)-lysidine synthetase [Balamuthia mandrillaris]
MAEEEHKNKTTEVSYKEVLRFWFEEGTLEELYKSKWFCVDGSPQQRETDQLIQARFGEVLLRAEEEASPLSAAWQEEGPLPLLALILVLDQFSRHVYRSRPQRDERVAANDRLALRYAERLIERGWERCLSVPQHIFLLMVFRHSPTIPRLKEVLERIDRRLQEEDYQRELLLKFRKTTLRRLQDLEGKLWATHHWDILEFHPFEADESDIESSKLYKTVEQFLKQRQVESLPALAISLSGGVDSMVLTKIVTHIRDKYKQKMEEKVSSSLTTLSNTFQVVAIHVDYANRPESGAEADYVEQWCEQRGVVFRKRTISEVTRGVTKREDYEEISRNIRFGFYKTVLEEFKGCPGVMFGHHKGDVQENVISNIMKGCSLVDLSGMHAESVINGVSIWRPMLPHPKSDIYSFSHKYGIPYFKDTTPKWSTRGKLRDQLMPLLQDMYGEGYLSNLSTMAEDSTQISEMVYFSHFKPFWESVQKSQVCVWVDCAPFLSQPLFFWKEALKHVCHSMLGTGMLREKSLEPQLLRRIRNDGGRRKTVGFVALKKENATYLEGTTLIIFRKEFFSPEAPYVAVGTSLWDRRHYNEEQEKNNINEHQFGPWKVRLELAPAEEESKQPMLDMWDVLRTGSFHYFLPNAPLYVVNPENRPKALRGIDKSITDAMPIVAAKGVFDEDEEGKQECCVKVTLEAHMWEHLGRESNHHLVRFLRQQQQEQEQQQQRDEEGEQRRKQRKQRHLQKKEREEKEKEKEGGTEAEVEVDISLFADE